MTSVEEQTLYDVLEVEPRATVEEIRAAHARAAEAFGPDSIAIYALVDDAQVEALRERLAEAAAVLLDPARRASYDRSIGVVPPGTLWDEEDEDDVVPVEAASDSEEDAEEGEDGEDAGGADDSEDAEEDDSEDDDSEDADDDEDSDEDAESGDAEHASADDDDSDEDAESEDAEHASADVDEEGSSPAPAAVAPAAMVPAERVGPGPHALATSAALEAEAPQASEEPAPEQRALDLNLIPGAGRFGRAASGTFAPEAESPPPSAPGTVAAVATAALGGGSATGAETASSVAPSPETPATDSPAPVPSLEHDWAAAVVDAAPTPAPEAAPAPARRPAAETRSGRPAPPPLPRSSFGIRRPAPSLRATPASSTAEGEEAAGREREARARLDIPPDAEFNGELLRQVRESYGLSLQQVSDRTRITRIHLENVEADRYDNLPATVYLRGILVNLARELRLDPARVSKSYLLVAQRAQVRGS